MEITTIEKAAKLMELTAVKGSETGDLYQQKDGRMRLFTPDRNKSDLMDVECALEIQVFWHPEGMVTVNKIYRHSELHSTVIQIEEDLDDHPNKFAARAHAVMAVVEQIYDAKFGKDGE